MFCIYERRAAKNVNARNSLIMAATGQGYCDKMSVNKDSYVLHCVFCISPTPSFGAKIIPFVGSARWMYTISPL